MATRPSNCQTSLLVIGGADMARVDNKVVLVSGGARGQGAAEARLLVAQGAKVVIGDVLDNQGQSLAVELGPAASFVRHDVTSEADWARAGEAAEKLGGLHGLVNNAGIYQPAALMETDDALWQRVHREYLVSCRPQGLARVLRLCRDQMGAAGHDQVGSHRPWRPQNPGELGPSRSNRYRHDRVPHARAARGADEAGADAPLRNAGGGCTAGGIPALRREQLHHRRGDRHRRRFIRLALTGWAATRNSAVCALTGHSAQPWSRRCRSIFSSSPIFAWRADRTSSRTRA